MASYVSVPRDLTKVKDKVAFNLTKRQLICFSIAVAMGLPTFFLVKGFATVTVASMVMMIVMMPLFFFAMYESNGQTLDVIIQHFVQATFIRPKVRPYKTDNYYAALMRQKQLEKEVEALVLEKEKSGQRGHKKG
ncbi:PrgI family protein [Butyrivibrio sp. INlla14]|uniref:PrgI family protein n=1 Tax=Butyrivibrio sp. INlla14 TaxID=1520808 RepID=UPI0008763C5D|nr:PrgI family protein [Butyrivibrio sp. INlla14]SCY63210.1 PrgI family protein [Butyrivibrio sp. INlla14]